MSCIIIFSQYSLQIQTISTLFFVFPDVLIDLCENPHICYYHWTCEFLTRQQYVTYNMIDLTTILQNLYFRLMTHSYHIRLQMWVLILYTRNKFNVWPDHHQSLYIFGLPKIVGFLSWETSCFNLYFHNHLVWCITKVALHVFCFSALYIKPLNFDICILHSYIFHVVYS